MHTALHLPKLREINPIKNKVLSRIKPHKKTDTFTYSVPKIKKTYSRPSKANKMILEFKNRLKGRLFYVFMSTNIKKALRKFPELKPYKNDKYLVWISKSYSAKSFEQELKIISENRKEIIQSYINLKMKGCSEQEKNKFIKNISKKEPEWLKERMHYAIRNRFDEMYGLD